MESVRSAYSTLACEDLVDKVLPNYSVGRVKDCIFWQRGFNDTYQVNSEQGNYILRIYRTDRLSLDNIQFEVDALRHFKEKNIQVSYPLARLDGDYLTPLSVAEGVRYAMLTPCAKGNVLAYESPDDAFLYGECVADIHSASATFQSRHTRPVIDRKNLVEHPIQVIRYFRGIDTAHIKYICQLGEKLAEFLAGQDIQSLDYGFCHGDFHGGNAHHSACGLEFFDFDFCGFGWRAYDLAVFRWSSRLHNKESERWQSFIAGYQSIRDIGQRDLNLTVALMAVRDIWLISQHIENAGVFARSWINNKYFHERVMFLKALEKEILLNSNAF